MKNHYRKVAAIIALSFGIAPVFAADIVDTATAAGTFKVFVAALETAGFKDTLKSSGPYTVFAPTDEAFAKLPAGTWDSLSKDKVKLAQVLAYHVIPGKMMVSEVKPGKVKTTQGGSLTLTSDNGKVTVNDANITQSDVTADNGVIHAIDTVVLPK
ncbi:MAG: fasciclin protein [Herminiimonas sp.]|nr:fasciclin protein [Herminiimonas sp.]